MKNNHKNRKLKFIRLKNKLRLGKSKFKSAFKISYEMHENINIDSYVVDSQTQLFKIFKLNLRNSKIEVGHEQDDFIRHLRTVLITLYN